jgi:hypothetical protein
MQSRFLVIVYLFIHVAGPAQADLVRTNGEKGVSGRTGIFSFRDGGLQFEWDYIQDKASLVTLAGQHIAWEGSLIPAFWLRVHQKNQFVKPSVVSDSLSTDAKQLLLGLSFGALGRGSLVIVREDWGFQLSELSILWSGEIPSILEMYVGVSDKGVSSSLVPPTWDRPFMPDWQSTGFCVPGAKGGTPQSFFRSWDFGQATIALGSFGPSMGSPYGAAYPRPVLYAAMGSDSGCLSIGAGSIPDAAMSLKVQSTKGCFQYLYSEDLWGKAMRSVRVWKDLLRISLGTNAWMAFQKYYHSFPSKIIRPNKACPAIWNTWGMWGQGKYPIRPIADFARSAGAGLLVLDGGWESAQGEGKPNETRFPHFEDDLRYVRDKGMEIGVWESIGWISDPFSHGLKEADLICNRKGKPCKANWNFDPGAESYYCLDISSPATRDFIRQRTIRIMKTLRPRLIKLDFGYGLPDPYMGVPKNPAFRGERYAHELVKLIAETAKGTDPNVQILYYGISPLWTDVTDIVSLDDQGDLWYDTERGHDEWSIWSALSGDRNMVLCGSSGYSWEKDEEAVLNTSIIGCPGAVLPVMQKNDSAVDMGYTNRRLAVDTWYRKTLSWQPLWLNSDPGNFSSPPTLRCWGRLETVNGDTLLTALVLREKSEDGIKKGIRDERISYIHWIGNWAMIAQDSGSVFSSGSLALIPFGAGSISLSYAAKPASILLLNKDGWHAFEDYSWQNGVLEIRISDESVRKIAGVLIKR